MMKFYLISDNIDTLIGMRMVGVEGVVVHEKQEVLQTLETCLNDSEIAIVMITLPLASLIQEKLNELKMKIRTPLIVEIPTRRCNEDVTKMLDECVASALGMKL